MFPSVTIDYLHRFITRPPIHTVTLHILHLIRVRPKTTFLALNFYDLEDSARGMMISLNRRTLWPIFFLTRGYPPSVVAAADDVSNISISEALEPANKNKVDRVPLVLTCHLQNLATALWSIVSRGDDTRSKFPERLLCAFRRDKNLIDQLVRSRLRDAALVPGTFTCSRNRCGTCKHICPSQKVAGPPGNHTILGHFTCTTRGVCASRR